MAFSCFKDLARRTPLNAGDELMCSGRVRSSRSTCDTCQAIANKIMTPFVGTVSPLQGNILFLLPQILTYN
jgi:hypothetical protein